MVTEKEIQHYIDKIPPTPAVLQQTLAFINEGDLTKAAKAAQEDPALRSYLKVLVNRPIYGFKGEVSNLPQIFGILGTSGAQQVLYNYMMSLLSPDSWHLFKLTDLSFHELQAQLSRKWHDILQYEGINDKDIESAITLLPASIIICEALFKGRQEEVALLRSTKALDYNTILKRLSGKDLFDISEDIANSWEMPQIVIDLLHATSGLHPSSDKTVDRLGRWMHLLLFFELSQENYVKAGLNDFLDFDIDYVEAIYEPFTTLMDIQ